MQQYIQTIQTIFSGTIKKRLNSLETAFGVKSLNRWLAPGPLLWRAVVFD
jgi:hypothetical protein